MGETNDIKVSIIIPVYNTEKYLRRCLASVCCQTLHELEIICINDGSTDNSLSILQEFAKHDNRIVIITKENGGVASSRNKGLQVAKAPYIGFVDSDDFIAPDMYEKMNNAMILNEVDFVECGAVLINTYARNGTDSNNINLTKLRSGKIEDPDTFMGTSNDLWKILFKKELIIGNCLSFPEGFNTYEDSLFVFSYKSISQCGFYIPENLYIYFFYENSIMGKSHAKKQGQRVTELLETVILYYTFLHTHGYFERLKNFFWNYFVTRINMFYEWSTPEIIQSTGIGIIQDLLKNEDISKLAEENNKSYLKFITLNKKKLMDLSFIDRKQKLKRTIRKIVKCLLPYGVIRIIQKYKKGQGEQS
jgi:glycosyltransferase involved in cell wall biosynthesis